VSHATVYIRRAGGGSVITGARLVHARGELEWHAPMGVTGNGADAPQIQVAIKACAQWIRKGLESVPGEPQLTLCLDMDGSRCSWYSAPSADEQLVSAAISAAQLAGENAESPGSLAWLGRHEVGTDISVQPLAEPTTRAKQKSRKRTGDTTPQRVAVLASADLGIRLLLDELDLLSSTPARVVSLMHLLGEGWQDRKAAPDSECAATIIIDPRGQLIWSWTGNASAGGVTLLCGGTIRLRTTLNEISLGIAEGTDPAQTVLARRDETPADTTDVGRGVIEISRGDIGRLITEWLAWSTQLGLAPRRVSCVGPANVVCAGLDDDLPHAPGIAAMAQTIGRAWSGAIVSAKVDDDPILSTLRQSVIACNDLGIPGAKPKSPGVKAALRASEAEPVDGRLGLLELSRRPGRASRRVYAWNFVMLVGAAVLVASVGYKLQSAAGTLDEQRLARANATSELLLTVRDVAPGAATDPDPAAILRRSLKDMEETQKKITSERPVLTELARVMRAIDTLTDRQLELKSLALGSNEAGLFSLNMSEADTSTILSQRMAEQTATGPWMDWKGGQTRPTKLTDGQPQAYQFTIAGVWVETPKPKSTSSAAGPKPTTTTQPPATPSAPAASASTPPPEPAGANSVKPPASGAPETPAPGTATPAPTPTPTPTPPPTPAPAPSTPPPAPAPETPDAPSPDAPAKPDPALGPTGGRP